MVTDNLSLLAICGKEQHKGEKLKMKIYNQEKTMQIAFPDLDKGYLVDGKVQIGQSTGVIEVKEQGHFIVDKEYPNGGKDVKWIVDVPYVAPKPSEPIFEDIKVYIPYSLEELRAKKEQRFCEQYQSEISELDIALEYLRATDYKAIQFAEGVLSPTEFESIKQQRIAARNKVRILKPLIENARVLAGL